MKKLHPFLMALCTVTILLPAAASNSTAQQTGAAGAGKTEDSPPSASKPVTPHNHMRDAKGMSIPPKQAQIDDGAKPTADQSVAAQDTKEKTSAKKKPRPHSHPQDAKGMYVPDKK